jgi:transposase-like protein
MYRKAAPRPGKTDRNRPRNAASSDATATVFDFEARFPDDAACLEELVRMFYPDGIRCPTCQKVTKHHRLKNRPAYECQWCGHMEYPMKGTIFEGSSTSLKLWFYGMYLMASTRCGISAKQLEREIGVSYPTALRMFRRIRSLLDQGDVLLEGTVELDETYVGGKDYWKHESKKPHAGRGMVTKTTVFGMAQRGRNGSKGKVVVRVAPTSRAADLLPHIKEKVLPASTVYTDQYAGYNSLDSLGYKHSRVNHEQKVYVSGDVHTNTIEGFWANTKRGIRGVYHAVSDRHLQSYLDEYAFRYNHRETPDGMFDAFLGRIAKSI